MRTSRLACLLVLLFCSRAFAEDLHVKQERPRAKSVLRLVSSELKKYFHDATMNGLDWEAQVAETEARIERAQSVSGMYTAIVALVDKLNDSHTHFYPPGRVAYPKYGFRSRAIGDKVFVYKLNPKGSASKAGMQVGDQILKVMNFPVTRKNHERMMQFFTTVQPLAQMQVTLLREGQEVQVSVEPQIVKTTMSVDLFSRGYNPYEYLKYREFPIPRSYVHTANPEGIGYMYMSEFVYDTSPADWADSIGPMKGMILDLRDNHGGSVDTLENMAGFFVNRKMDLSQVVFKDKARRMEVKPRRSGYTAGPLVILLDEGSASASEALTRFLQLHREQVTVIGDTSMGALTQSRTHYEQIGSDASFVPFFLQIGEARIVFSDGSSVEKVGVRPDISCLPTPTDLKSGADPCLKMALQELRKIMKLEGEARALGTRTVINHWGLE